LVFFVAFPRVIRRSEASAQSASGFLRLLLILFLADCGLPSAD